MILVQNLFNLDPEGRCKPQTTQSVNTKSHAYLTVERELGAAVTVPCSPVGLVGHGSVLANALGLPWLVEGLEVEEVDAPRRDAADGLLPVLLGSVETWRSSLVFRSIGGPSCLMLTASIIV